MAPVYDAQLLLERAAIRRMIELARIASADRVCDLGTGTGAVLRHLRSLPEPPRRVLGVDRSRRMLDRVGELPEGWELERAEADAVPQPDGSFDRVTAAYLLHLLEPGMRAKVLAEVRRLLRPGGILATVTVAPPESGTERLLRAPLRLAGRVLLGGAMSPLDPRGELQRAGFELVAFDRTRRGYPSLCIVTRLPS